LTEAAWVWSLPAISKDGDRTLADVPRQVAGGLSDGGLLKALPPQLRLNPQRITCGGKRPRRSLIILGAMALNGYEQSDRPRRYEAHDFAVGEEFLPIPADRKRHPRHCC